MWGYTIDLSLPCEACCRFLQQQTSMNQLLQCWLMCLSDVCTYGAIQCEKRRKGDWMDGRVVRWIVFSVNSWLLPCTLLLRCMLCSIDVVNHLHWLHQLLLQLLLLSANTHTHTHKHTYTGSYLEPMHATQTGVWTCSFHKMLQPYSWTLTHWDHQWLCPGWLPPPSDGWWLSVSLKPVCLPTRIAWMKANFTLRISKGRAF